LKIKTNLEAQPFNDGVIDVFATDDNLQAINPAKYPAIRFESRTIGAQRQFVASQQNYDIALLIRIPKIPIDNCDIIKLNGMKYEIMQKQEIFDASPPCLQLTLKETGAW